jgi:hypothetical protein
MPEPDRNVALLSSLRGLVRGLSALFWALPLGLVIAVQTYKGDWLKPLGFAPITGATALLLYGVLLLGGFQKQERVWTEALERARLLAVINVGLSPFLFFWSKMSGNLFFTIISEMTFITMLAFLYSLNSVLARLAAMLPDETLRGETKIFTRLNHTILLIIMVSLPFYFLLHAAPTLPRVVVEIGLFFERGGALLDLMLMMIFILLPVAMTMALIWKTKEVIMASVFSGLGVGEQPPNGG